MRILVAKEEEQTHARKEAILEVISGRRGRESRTNDLTYSSTTFSFLYYYITTASINQRHHLTPDLLQHATTPIYMQGK